MNLTFKRVGIATAPLMICAILPLVIGNYNIHVLTISFYYAILAASWSLLDGYTGIFSLGHVAMATIGGYTVGLLGRYWGLPIPVGILLGTIAAGIFGMIIGFLCLSLRGPYLALFTLGFSEILRRVINGEYKVTRGAKGLHVAPFFQEAATVPGYYIFLGALVISLSLMYIIVKSRLGLFFRSIREGEKTASVLGVNVVKYKILSFMIGSAFAGFAGTMYARTVGILTPKLTKVTEMGLVLGMAILGGVENIFAAAFGAIVVKFSLEALREFGPLRLVIFGLLLMVTLRFAREGLGILIVRKARKAFHLVVKGRM